MISPPKGRPISLRAFKALQACRRYYILDKRIKEVTRELGNTICTSPKYSAPSPFEFEHEQSSKPCIEQHYYGPVKIPYEKMCMGCKDKHSLIQYRKELRRKLGAAKRWINALGKEEDNNVR